MASLVFLIMDSYDKTPVMDAGIVCKGIQASYSKKRSGHYVFSNLQAGKYKMVIFCKGYLDKRVSVRVRENESRTIILNLAYAKDNPTIRNVTRFAISVTEDGIPLKNADVRVKLKNEISSVKLVKPAAAQTDGLSLNVKQNAGLVVQKYLYDQKGTQTEIFVCSYSGQRQEYLLEDYLETPLEPGGTFYPIWDLATDDSGVLILPLFKQFVKEGPVQLEIKRKNKLGSVDIELPQEEVEGSIIYSSVNLEDPTLIKNEPEQALQEEDKNEKLAKKEKTTKSKHSKKKAEDGDSKTKLKGEKAESDSGDHKKKKLKKKKSSEKNK